MNSSASSTAPSTLYAIILKLRPQQHGTLMPFSGELVHGAWLKWLGTAAPDVAAWLHDEKQPLKNFSSSISTLQHLY